MNEFERRRLKRNLIRYSENLVTIIYLILSLIPTFVIMTLVLVYWLFSKKSMLELEDVNYIMYKPKFIERVMDRWD